MPPPTKIVHIVAYDGLGFDVVIGGAIAGHLTYGEMLETVIFNLLPAPTHGYELLTRTQIAERRALRVERQAEGNAQK